MKFYVGFTDEIWFANLSKMMPDEVNFWRPGGGKMFKALQPGEMFLFKLKKPNHFIAGGGFFAQSSILPVSLAWDAFGVKNGRKSLVELREAVNHYRKKKGKPEQTDPFIGCVALTQLFFLPRELWIPAPESWSSHIVEGKTYDLQDPDGSEIWKQLQIVLKDQISSIQIPTQVQEAARYGQPKLTKNRLGQGSFRVAVIEAYSRSCAMTGEKVLPALVAAHIQPYAENGPHLVSNGMLLRSDLHMLFDAGLIGVTPEMRITVSRCIKENFGNSSQYYALQNQVLRVLPKDDAEKPDLEFLDWHKRQRFQF